MISVISNGSKWYGQAPDSIEKLIEVLKINTLDPQFEKDFVREVSPGCISFFGNFADISHVFNITTDEPEIAKALTNAIQENLNSQRYQKAKKGYCGRMELRQLTKEEAGHLTPEEAKEMLGGWWPSGEGERRLHSQEGRKQLHRVFLHYRYTGKSWMIPRHVLESHVLAPISPTSSCWFARELSKRDEIIQEAISEGEPVPKDVLKEYGAKTNEFDIA